MNYFKYNGKSSRDFGLYISGDGTFLAPERDVFSVEIPGKNGTLTIDNGRFKNVMVDYPSFIRAEFKKNADAARAWLLSTSGYSRLEDTYHPDEYRMAQFIGPLDFETRFLQRAGECTLSFDCKPQRFLRLGERKTTLSKASILYNPTQFEALPLIRIYGTTDGVLTIGDNIIQIKTIKEYVDLDCETQNAFKGLTNCNNDIDAPTFPTLPAGESGISWSGSITKVEIIPRWWTI